MWHPVQPLTTQLQPTHQHVASLLGQLLQQAHGAALRCGASVPGGCEPAEGEQLCDILGHLPQHRARTSASPS
jgi:hypothetical protein